MNAHADLIKVRATGCKQDQQYIFISFGRTDSRSDHTRGGGEFRDSDIGRPACRPLAAFLHSSLARMQNRLRIRDDVF